MAAIEHVRMHPLNHGLTQLLVEIIDTDGVSGIGECWWGIPDAAEPGRGANPIASTVESIVAPRIVGREASQVQALWYEVMDFGQRYGDQGIFTMALSGVDLALWDLLGKRHGCPVVDMLGGATQQAVPAYASLPPLRDLDVLAAECQRAAAEGFTGIKLHEHEVAQVHAARAAVGPDVEIMVDVNGWFRPEQAHAFDTALREAGILWFEEPISPMRDVEAIAAVGQSLETPLAGGENEYSLRDFERLLASGALTWVQPEITKIGGLTPALRIGALAELHNTALAPHNFRLGPSLLASIHWGFTSPQTTWFEVPFVRGDAAFPAQVSRPALEDGCVTVPKEPGFGAFLPT